MPKGSPRACARLACWIDRLLFSATHRVVICGRVALAGQFRKRFMGHLIVTRASIHGFLAFDWWHRRDEALQRLSNWQRAGQIKFKEDVLEGIERMPEGFLRLLSGKNFGKQIIKIV